MESKVSPLFRAYQWLLAFPLLLVITMLMALLTIILSPLLPNSKFSYYPGQFWAKAWCWLCFVKVEIAGLEKLNPMQSYVFALNHQSLFDIFVVYGWFPCIFKWMMKAELRKIPLVGKACESAGHIFIDRSNPIAAKHSLDKAEAQLKNGVSLVIFPEGTRTRTGKMGPFKRGAFRISTDLLLPIVPVTLCGSFERLPRNSFNVNPGTIRVLIHDPLEVGEFLPGNTSGLMQKTQATIEAALN